MNLNTAAQSVVTGITVCQASWLQISGLLKEVQAIKNLHVEGMHSLSSRTDKALHSLKDSRTALRSLGICTPAPYLKSFWYHYHQRLRTPLCLHSHQPEYPPTGRDPFTLEDVCHPLHLLCNNLPSRSRGLMGHLGATANF